MDGTGTPGDTVRGAGQCEGKKGLGEELQADTELCRHTLCSRQLALLVCGPETVFKTASLCSQRFRSPRPWDRVARMRSAVFGLLLKM